MYKTVFLRTIMTYDNVILTEYFEMLFQVFSYDEITITILIY